MYSVLGLSLIYIKCIKVRTICTLHYLRIIDNFVFWCRQFVLALLQTHANERFDNSSFSVFFLLRVKHISLRFSFLSCALKFKTNRADDGTFTYFVLPLYNYFCPTINASLPKLSQYNADN